MSIEDPNNPNDDAPAENNEEQDNSLQLEDDEQIGDENVVNLETAQAEETPLTPEAIIAQMEQELASAKDRTMRALADAENTRRRAIKDRDDAGKYAIANFARNLLDFSDNFKRAFDSVPEDLKNIDPRISSILDGLQAMDRELQGVFEKNGVRKIEPLDEPFDANFHEVMFEAPMPGKQAGTIIQVVEPGYVINDRLLRAAKVGIAKAGEEAPAPQQNTDPGSNIDQKA